MPSQQQASEDVTTLLRALKAAALRERERDSVAAAAALEDAVAAAERRRSSARNTQDSALPIQLAQQLSADAAATLEVLIKYTGALQGECGLSYEIVWLLVRPVLRVILWLLPEHVMTAADGTGPCTSTSSNNSNSSSSGNSSSNFTGVLYVTSVATAPLVEAIKILVFRRDHQKRWRDNGRLRPGQQGYALMEEFLFWVAVLHRLHTLAYELQLDLAPTSSRCTTSAAAQPSAAPPAAPAPLLVVPATACRDAIAFCSAVWVMLTNHIPGTVTRLSEFVLSWAVNHLESLTASSQHKKHDPSWPLAFGALYVPSEHVVSAVGVWGTPLEVASHAADIAAAVPSKPLIRSCYVSGVLFYIHAKMLAVIQFACKLLYHKHVVPPYMSREKLQESLRGLGPLTQKHLRGLVLSFLENPTSGTVNHPLFFITWVTGTVGAAIAEMNMLLMINVHGSETFQQPRNFPKQMLEHSFVLNRITCAGSTQAHPTGQKLPPAPLDGQHLSEWREAADYAATTLAVLAGIVDLETSSFKSPLLGVGPSAEVKQQWRDAVAAFVHLLDTVKPLTSSDFLHGAPGSRAYAACLAGISAAVCSTQQRVEHGKWEGADAAAWELVLARVLPRLRDLQGTAHLLAVGGVADPQQQQQQQQQQLQQQETHEQAGLLAQEQGSQHSEQAGSGEGDRHTSDTTCAFDPCRGKTVAPLSGGGVGQTDARPAACPPADLALLLLMAAARSVKAGVNFHCFGSHCCKCNLWHSREPAGGGAGSGQGVEGEGGGSSSSEGGELHSHKEQPSNSCEGCSMAGQVDPSPGLVQFYIPGLKDLDQLEEALDILLTLVHCLVVRGAWWQQAVSRHPLLLVQVLMTVADALYDITVNLLSTPSFGLNRRLLDRCSRQGGQPVQHCEHAPCPPNGGSPADLPKGTAAAGGGSRESAAATGVPNSAQDSTTAGTPGSQPGTSQAGSSSDQAGGCSDVSSSPQADHSYVREHNLGNTSKACTVRSQAMGSATEDSVTGCPVAEIVSSSSSTTTTTTTTTAGEALLSRPTTRNLLISLCKCVSKLVLDPVIMGDAHQPAPWMPDSESILESVFECQRKVQVCLRRAVHVAYSKRQQQEMCYLQAFLRAEA